MRSKFYIELWFICTISVQHISQLYQVPVYISAVHYYFCQSFKSVNLNSKLEQPILNRMKFSWWYRQSRFLILLFWRILLLTQILSKSQWWRYPSKRPFWHQPPSSHKPTPSKWSSAAVHPHHRLFDEHPRPRQAQRALRTVNVPVSISAQNSMVMLFGEIFSIFSRQNAISEQKISFMNSWHDWTFCAT